MALGTYNNFPPNIQYIETYLSTVSKRPLQQKLIQCLNEVNRKELSFEDVSIPTIPNGQVIFEFGIAEEGNFNYLSPNEAQRVLAYVARVQVAALDFFCSIRYYRGKNEGRQALKFDYYLFRLLFGKGTLELQVFHERGPRYLSPQDLTEFLIKKLNGTSNRKILKESTSRA